MKPFRLLLATCLGLSALAAARAAEPASGLIPRYEQISAALAADNLAGAKAAAGTLATEAAGRHQDAMAATAQTLATAGDLAAARTAFKTLSIETIALARRQKGYFVLHCPMARADWVQSTREVANPYLGQDMPTCGTVKEETKG